VDESCFGISEMGSNKSNICEDTNQSFLTLPPPKTNSGQKFNAILKGKQYNFMKNEKWTRSYKMLFYHLCFASSLSPMVLLPPLYGSNLYVTYKNDSSLKFYCPKKITNKMLWVNPMFVVPPMFNCLFQLMQVYWDEEMQNFKSRPNTTIFVRDFGGDVSVKYVDQGIFGYHFIESFASLLKDLKHKGYIIHQNLFAAPFDWRMAVAGLDEYWHSLKYVIEHAYILNNNTKVIVFGFSCGGFTLQYFLGNIADQEWKDKYIDRAIFLAPSFGGSGMSFGSLWEKALPILPILKNDDLAAMIDSMPVIHQHLPNWAVFGDKAVVQSPHDEVYNASQIPDLLIEKQKITGDNIKIMKKAVNLSRLYPKPPGVPTMIIYNTAVDTEFFYHFKNGWEKPAIIKHEGGDGTILRQGPEYACKNWPAPIVCIDLYRDHDDFNHQPLASNPYVHKLIYDATSNNDWIRDQSRTLIRSPYVIVGNGTYTVLDEIRPEKVNKTPN